jgi:hypothetical protein
MQVCKALCFGHLGPENWPVFAVCGGGQPLVSCAAFHNLAPQIFVLGADRIAKIRQ